MRIQPSFRVHLSEDLFSNFPSAAISARWSTGWRWLILNRPRAVNPVLSTILCSSNVAEAVSLSWRTASIDAISALCSKAPKRYWRRILLRKSIWSEFLPFVENNLFLFVACFFSVWQFWNYTLVTFKINISSHVSHCNTTRSRISWSFFSTTITLRIARDLFTSASPFCSSTRVLDFIQACIDHPRLQYALTGASPVFPSRPALQLSAACVENLLEHAGRELAASADGCLSRARSRVRLVLRCCARRVKVKESLVTRLAARAAENATESRQLLLLMYRWGYGRKAVNWLSWKMTLTLHLFNWRYESIEWRALCCIGYGGLVAYFHFIAQFKGRHDRLWNSPWNWPTWMLLSNLTSASFSI